MATFTIAELAREFDITARAIRFYEDQGLLSPMREGVGGRNRVYTPRDRSRLKLTLRGKRLRLHPVHTAKGAADKRAAQARYDSASGTFTIPARTAVVFVSE